MKTIRTARSAAVILLALFCLCPAATADNMDGVMMEHGKMMMMKMGKPTGPMTSDMTMSNGTKVTMDGTIIMSDGTKDQMKDGQMMMMDGKIMEGGKATGMANQ